MEYERSDAVDDRLELLRVYGYGLCMGTADALPGVSGGTVALLLGFYGRLIAAVTALTPWRAAAVLRGYHPDRRTQAREALLEMDLGFLLPLGVGIATAIVLIADLVSSLAQSHPVAMFGFFTGLIAASVITLGRSLSISSPTHVAAAVTGTGLALLVAADVVSPIAVEGLGLRILRARQEHWKPSTNAVQRFCRDATENVVVLDDEEAACFARGDDQELPRWDGDWGYVVAAHEIAGDIEPIGVGLYLHGELRSTVPKGRREDLE